MLASALGNSTAPASAATGHLRAGEADAHVRRSVDPPALFEYQPRIARPDFVSCICRKFTGGFILYVE
jgi:hypothetical protein